MKRANSMGDGDSKEMQQRVVGFPLFLLRGRHSPVRLVCLTGNKKTSFSLPLGSRQRLALPPAASGGAVFEQRAREIDDRITSNESQFPNPAPCSRWKIRYSITFSRRRQPIHQRERLLSLSFLETEINKKNNSHGVIAAERKTRKKRGRDLPLVTQGDVGGDELTHATTAALVRRSSPTIAS